MTLPEIQHQKNILDESMYTSVIKILVLFLAFLCFFHSSPLIEATVCFVKPTEPHNTTCPSEPCYTLNDYVSNSTRYFISNTVFMFLNGTHDLSYDLTVSDVYNIALRPYIEKSEVVIASELQYNRSLMFKSAIHIAIRHLTIKTLGIQFKNSTNVTLTGLTAENASITLNNVFGEVNISYIKSKNHDKNIIPIEFTWTVPQSQYTVVVLHELDLTGVSGISISGCLPGKVILVNSTLNVTNNATMYMNLDVSCKGIGNLLLMCENTHFYNGLYGLVVSAQTPLLYNEYIMQIALHNVSFTGNIFAVTFTNIHNATICDCYFGSSGGGAIRATNSVLSFMGNVAFRDNHSIFNGGALSLLGDSHILIPEPNNTYILFENNTTDDVGGAIAFSSCESDTDLIGYCKIYVEQHSSNIVFNFSLNSALNGGNAIYGAYLDGLCYTPNRTLVDYISQLILSVSSFSPSFANDHSVVTSDPYRLCICDEDGKLENCYGHFLSVYPGQIFRVSVAAIGDMDGLVKWPVYAKVLSGEFGNTIQHTQTSSAERCTYFHYSVLSNESTATLQLSLIKFQEFNYGDTCDYFVNLLDCPLGFTSASYGCECLQLLSDTGSVKCNITEPSIQRKGTTWIGVLENNISNNTLVFSNVCPFLYCKKSSVNITVSQTFFLNEDIQCSDNRSGVLCGGCRDGLSLALGSNRCLHGCSDSSISFLIAFAAAGIALFFFIKILNLTVSQGTINGLIFYANIVGAEQTILFSSKAYEEFLSVFIAWVNLDLGIETCFFDGMDAYAKAWLQFVFPVYIWVIALFIITLSHYSIRASQLFGNNSVPVLATLILLSYSKLLRAIISALSITHIQFLNGSTMSVWERDGNIQYLSRKHIPLFVFAVAVLVVIWLPFTLILVFIQWLQRGTHYRVLHWITKLRPFFEAFTGPLKDKHRYWVGALLLARCSLLLVFYVYTVNGSKVALFSITFATVMILFFLAATDFVYRNYYLTILELSYILNLGMLAIGTLYVLYNNGNQEALVVTTVSIAFLQFVATVVYHAYVQLRKPLKKFRTVFNQLKEKLYMGGQEDTVNGPDHEEYEPLAEASFGVEPLQRPPFQEIPNFRESLLDYLND